MEISEQQKRIRRRATARHLRSTMDRVVHIRDTDLGVQVYPDVDDVLSEKERKALEAAQGALDKICTHLGAVSRSLEK